MRSSKVAAGSVLTVLILGIWAAAASAHITIDPGSAPRGAGDQELTFRVPNEEPKANTTSIEIQFPTDHPIASVDPLAQPDWTTQVVTKHLDKPIKTDDGTFSDVVSTITWTGKIAPGDYADLKVLAMGLPTDTDSLTFKAIQHYDDGTDVAWIETGANAEHPAPVLTLTAAQGTTGQSRATDTSAASASAAPVTAPTSTKSSSDSSGLAVAGIVVGGLGLVVATVAVALALRRPD